MSTDERRVVGAGVVGAVALAGTLTALTDTPAVLGETPAGAFVYLLAGVALPQAVLYRRDGSPVRLGLAALASAAALFALAVPPGPWLPGGLLVVVLGVYLGAAGREAVAGYRAGRG